MLFLLFYLFIIIWASQQPTNPKKKKELNIVSLSLKKRNQEAVVGWGDKRMALLSQICLSLSVCLFLTESLVFAFVVFFEEVEGEVVEEEGLSKIKKELVGRKGKREEI